jgi:hypothetical protein
MPFIFLSYVLLPAKPLSLNLFQFEGNTPLEKKILRESKKLEGEVNSKKITAEKAISILCYLGLETLEEPSISLEDKRKVMNTLIAQSVGMNKVEGDDLYKATIAQLKRLQKENPKDKKLVEYEEYYKQFKKP